MAAEKLTNMNGTNLSQDAPSTLMPCSKMLNGFKIMVNCVSNVTAGEEFTSEELENYAIFQAPPPLFLILISLPKKRKYQKNYPSVPNPLHINEIFTQLRPLIYLRAS